MAKIHYMKRAQDSLDISAVADALVMVAKQGGRKAIIYLVQRHVSAFKQFKSLLESKLEALTTSQPLNWFSKLKNRSLARQIKEQLYAINRQMVEWVNRTYSYFFASND